MPEVQFQAADQGHGRPATDGHPVGEDQPRPTAPVRRTDSSKALVAEQSGSVRIALRHGRRLLPHQRWRRNRQFVHRFSQHGSNRHCRTTGRSSACPFGRSPDLDALSSAGASGTVGRRPPQRRHLLTRILTGRVPPYLNSSAICRRNPARTLPGNSLHQRGRPAQHARSQFLDAVPDPAATSRTPPRLSVDKEQCEHITLARIAALMQITSPPRPPSLRLGLVEVPAPASPMPRPPAPWPVLSLCSPLRTRSVWPLSLLSRFAANAITPDVLVRGLRYPWPKVSRNAVDAIVRLKREDLLPQLVALLEDADPARSSGSRR